MDSSEKRQQRLRTLVHKINQDRKRQSQKIDLLCHDLIDAQRDFIERLGSISFVAGFYKTLLGVTDLDQILDISGRHLHDLWPNASLSFFLKQLEGFRQYRIGLDDEFDKHAERLEHSFSDTLAETLCRLGKVCDQDDLIGLGLEANPTLLKSLSLMTLPLISGPRCIGFMLIYRPGQNTFSETDRTQVSRVIQGLAQAIEASEALSGYAQ